MFKKSLAILLSTLGVACSSSYVSSCPSIKDTQTIINSLQQGLTVKEINPSQLQGLCEIVLQLPNEEKAILYTDPAFKYLLTGNIIEVSSKKNLTFEKVSQLNKKVLSKELLTELDKNVAFTAGNSSNYVYFITDPECPFCKQAETALEPFIKEGRLSIKVVFFPLEVIHPKAKEKAISMICDKKGFEELKTGYESKNQCEEGKKKIEESINLMQKIGVRGTPAFIFPDGELRVGFMPPEAILEKLQK